MKNSPYIKRLEIHRAPLFAKRLQPLTMLDIELTERCNNNCIHCYINRPVDDTDAKAKELSTEKIKIILKDAAELGCLTVRLTGGEPLLRNDFEELYLFIRQLGIKVILFTNASLITPQIAELFARTPPLEPIEITVYGMNKPSYETVTRTSGSFETAWQGIHLIIDKKIPFSVKSAILPPNRNEINDFESWAASIPSIVDPPSYSFIYDLRAHRDSPEKNNRIKKLRLSPKESIRIFARHRQQYYKEMQLFCSRFMQPPTDNLFSCGAGKSVGNISAQGNFQLCLLLRHPKTVYDLKTENLKDALFRFSPQVRALKPVNEIYLERCSRCFLKGLCEQCPAKSWMEHGELDSPVNYLCNVAHEQAKFLGLIFENECAWKVQNWKKRVNKFLKRTFR